MAVVRTVVVVFLAVVASAAIYLAGIRLGWFGRAQPGGDVTRSAIPDATLAERAAADARAATAIGATEPKQILFGDLHVHTT